MGSADWIPIRDAPERVGKSTATVYRWIDDPTNEIRTMRPGQLVWVNIPDLLRVEAAKRPGRPKTRPAKPPTEM